MINEEKLNAIRDMIADVVMEDSHFSYESFEDGGYVSEDDFYVDNSEDVAEKVINKLIEMGIIEVENK